VRHTIRRMSRSVEYFLNSSLSKVATVLMFSKHSSRLSRKRMRRPSLSTQEAHVELGVDIARFCHQVGDEKLGKSSRTIDWRQSVPKNYPLSNGCTPRWNKLWACISKR
jgi:hypothetical protein